MGVELRPGLVSVGQNSAAPSPEMEAEAVAAVQPQICGVFGNEKQGPIMDDDLSAKSHHCSRIPTTRSEERHCPAAGFSVFHWQQFHLQKSLVYFVLYYIKNVIFFVYLLLIYTLLFYTREDAESFNCPPTDLLLGLPRPA